MLNLHRRPRFCVSDGRWFINSNTTPGFLAAGSWAATHVLSHAGPAQGEESAHAEAGVLSGQLRGGWTCWITRLGGRSARLHDAGTEDDPET